MSEPLEVGMLSADLRNWGVNSFGCWGQELGEVFRIRLERDLENLH